MLRLLLCTITSTHFVFVFPFLKQFSQVVHCDRIFFLEVLIVCLLCLEHIFWGATFFHLLNFSWLAGKLSRPK